MSTVDGVRRREVSTGRGPVTVFEMGEGPVLGCLHGMAGFVEGSALLHDLATTHRVIAPCLPGFGHTPPDPTLRTVHDWVVALSEIADATGIVGAPWLASSTSAMLALELAVVRPEAFSSLVAVAPTGLWDPADPGVDLYAVPSKDQAALLVNDLDLLGAFAADPEGLDGDELIELGVGRYVCRRTAASLVWPLPDHGLADRLRRVTAPVTLVWGADDVVVPPGYAGRFADLLPAGVVLSPIAGAAHLAELDAPGAVSDIVRTCTGN